MATVESTVVVEMSHPEVTSSYVNLVNNERADEVHLAPKPLTGKHNVVPPKSGAFLLMHMLNCTNQSAENPILPTDVAGDSVRELLSIPLEGLLASPVDLTDGLLEDPMLMADVLAIFESTFKELCLFSMVNPLKPYILLSFFDLMFKESSQFLFPYFHHGVDLG